MMTERQMHWSAMAKLRKYTSVDEVSFRLYTTVKTEKKNRNMTSLLTFKLLMKLLTINEIFNHSTTTK